MNSSNNAFTRYFGVFAQSKTYLNLLYLFLAFPLGLFYFIFLITGFSAGIPLVIVWVGLLVLALVFAISWALTAFERYLAIGLLRVKIPPMTRPNTANTGFWQTLKNYFSNPVTWKGISYLFLKFPIGLIAFILLVTLLSLSLSLIAVPFFYDTSYLTIDVYNIRIDTLSEAIVCALAGILMLPAFLHFFNFCSLWLGKFAQVMLGNAETAAPSPAIVVSEPAESTLTI